MAKYTLFDGTHVIGEYPTWGLMRITFDTTSDIYQSGYYYVKTIHEVRIGNLSDDPIVIRSNEGSWYKMDSTPVLLEDVPKQLRTLALLLNI